MRALGEEDTWDFWAWISTLSSMLEIAPFPALLAQSGGVPLDGSGFENQAPAED
jgi:hypothetical protein